MVPSGPPAPVGGAQSVPPSLLRSNSALPGGGQPGSMASQQQYSSLVSPRTQFSANSNGGSMSMLGNIPSVSSLLNHSFANGAPGPGGSRAGGDMLGSGEANPMSFSSSSGAAQGQHFHNSSAAQDYALHVTQSRQTEGMQNFHQVAGSHNQQHPQLRGGFGNVGGVGPVRMEQQGGAADQNGPLQQLQSMRGLGGVKLEPQQLQSVRNMGPIKLERQLSDSSIFFQQQQQQQQYLQLSRHSTQASAAQISMLHQQRLMQLHQQQQQQQQQLLKTMPHQRIQVQQQQQLQQQQQQQLQQQQQQLQQGLLVRPQGKPMMYEPGMCARKLMHYMYQQQRRPEDNNIQFWRSFVAEYFAPNAKKRWCVSLYGSGRQTTGVFPQDIWHCEICNRKPGRGFETTVEVLPRLFQIKYASGTLEELLYVDMPHEYQNASGQIVLDYNKAVQQSVFDQLRVVREGQLRIVFSLELKISSWEFCARRHDELIPRRLVIPQVTQLGAVAQKYQQATSNASNALSAQDLQNFSNSFVASARQIAKTLEVPLVNDLGYTKRYVRCLQISEVVNSMKDLIDYSRETGTGPMDSLINFPRRSSVSSGHPGQQPMAQNQNQNGQNPVHASGMQISSASTGVTSLNSSLNSPSFASMSSTSIAGRLHQNSMNSRQENNMSNASNSYGGGNTTHIPSASSSSALLQTQPNPSSPFPSPTPSTSNNIPTPTSHGNANLNSNSPMSGMQQSMTQPPETDPSDSQSSVQQILQEIMMSPQMNGASALSNEMSGITQGINAGNDLVGNGMSIGPSDSGMGFGGSMGPSANANGLRGAMTNNVMSLNGRVGVNHLPHNPMAMNHQHQQQQQDMGNPHLSELGSANSFNNFHFDWKSSP